MRNLTILLALTFSVMFSSPSFAEWKKVVEDRNGNTHYVDFDSIRKHGGYVYWWSIIDHLKPTEHGFLSERVYRQTDCKLFRYKYLTGSFHKEPMGGRNPITIDRPKNIPPWGYPPPGTVLELIQKTVCAYAK